MSGVNHCTLKDVDRVAVDIAIPVSCRQRQIPQALNWADLDIHEDHGQYPDDGLKNTEDDEIPPKPRFVICAAEQTAQKDSNGNAC